MQAPPAAPPTPPPLPDVPRSRAAWAVAVYVAAAAAVVGAAATLFAFNPTSTRLFPPCPFRAATGLHCPGCGSTRAMHHLLHGRVATAFDFNPLLVASLPFMGYAVARQLIPAKRPPRALPAWTIWLLFAVVLAFGVLRNLPWKPTRWMAP